MDDLPWRLRDPSTSVCFLVTRYYSVKLQVLPSFVPRIDGRNNA
jgi:hypothetical protein